MFNALALVFSPEPVEIVGDYWYTPGKFPVEGCPAGAFAEIRQGFSPRRGCLGSALRMAENSP
ncbi:MAG: hypothetical protein LBE17_13635 [Treponema sp.]|jgi:hypothetical protein|nr:hypothetical protein [Treponema sp.]